MAKTILLSSILICSALTTLAQKPYMKRVREVVPGKGVVILHHDAELELLVSGPKGAPQSVPAVSNHENSEQSKTERQRDDVKDGKTNKANATQRDNDAEKEKSENDSSLDRRYHVYNKKYKTKGFRIQLYAGGNSRADRQNATKQGQLCKSNFPELPVYTHFYPPRWVCRVGDFKSIEEANKYLREIRATKLFKASSIIKTQIQVSY